MNLTFLPYDYDYITIRGKTYIKIFGRTSKGKSCCVIDSFQDYFYILDKAPEKIIKKVKKIEPVKKAELINKNYLEKPVKAIKVFCEYKDKTEIANKVKIISKKSKTRERDISIITKYIINKQIKPFVWYDIEGELLSDTDLSGLSNSLETSLSLKLKNVKQSDKKDFNPKVLAFDIEAEEFEIGKGEILMISLYSENFKKVLTWKSCKNPQKYVECYKTEMEMLKAFEKYVNEIDADIITGYFSDGFDLPYLRARAEENGIDLKLSKDNSRILFSRGRPIKARTKGLLHIDLIKFIQTVYSQYLKSETLSLDEVASELLGEKKLEVDHTKKMHERNNEDWKNFFKYNLKDSELTYRLFQKLWPDLQEFTKIIPEPPFKVIRYGLSRLVESFIIHNLNRFNEIAEKKPTHNQIAERRLRGSVEGAFVFTPEAGLYENLAIFDFTSMHTSIIISFNISKTTLIKSKQKNCYESPEVEFDGKKRFYFSKKQGFIPNLLTEIINLRKKYKKQLKQNPNPITKARSNAFKLLSASVHGYVGFYGARYYCGECSASTLAFVRKFNKDAIEKVQKAGYQVIFADTDSVGFTLGEKTKNEVKNFLKQLNSELPGIMELELEGFFKRGIWVTKRTGEFGAKKKYALIDYDDELKIRGFETVRRDWCPLARTTQNKVLKKILENGNEEQALTYIKKIIKKIKNREIDKKQLIVRTQLKKPISEYKSLPPHVVIAKKMKQQGETINPGKLISYYIAESRSKNALVRERAALPDEDKKYDINYYIYNQIVPAVENIFEVFDVNTQDIAKGSEQKKLSGF